MRWPLVESSKCCKLRCKACPIHQYTQSGCLQCCSFCSLKACNCLQKATATLTRGGTLHAGTPNQHSDTVISLSIRPNRCLLRQGANMWPSKVAAMLLPNPKGRTAKIGFTNCRSDHTTIAGCHQHLDEVQPKQLQIVYYHDKWYHKPNIYLLHVKHSFQPVGYWASGVVELINQLHGLFLCGWIAVDLWYEPRSPLPQTPGNARVSVGIWSPIGSWPGNGSKNRVERVQIHPNQDQKQQCAKKLVAGFTTSIICREKRQCRQNRCTIAILHAHVNLTCKNILEHATIHDCILLPLWTPKSGVKDAGKTSATRR